MVTRHRDRGATSPRAWAPVVRLAAGRARATPPRDVRAATRVVAGVSPRARRARAVDDAWRHAWRHRPSPRGRPGVLRRRAFTADDVAEFARLSHDANPIHLDPTAAARAGFPGPVVHGMLCASLFGAIIGTRFPGAVYAAQSLRFAPVLVGNPSSQRCDSQKSEAPARSSRRACEGARTSS